MYIHTPKIPKDIEKNVKTIIDNQIQKSNFVTYADYMEARKSLATQLVTISNAFESACEIGLMIDGNPINKNGITLHDCFAYNLWEFVTNQVLTLSTHKSESARDYHILTETTKHILRQPMSSDIMPINDTLYATNTNFYRLSNILNAVKIELGVKANGTATINQDLDLLKQTKMVAMESQRETLVKKVNEECSPSIVLEK